jgi:hypothetical protein
MGPGRLDEGEGKKNGRASFLARPYLYLRCYQRIAMNQAGA